MGEFRNAEKNNAWFFFRKFTHDRLWRAAANLLQTMDTTTNIGGKRHGNWVERLQVENFGNLESFRKLIFECVLETLQISDGNPSEGHRFGRYQVGLNN